MESRDSSAGSGQRGKSNLLAIGSAAVLAIYGAGFFRTRAAAQRFSDESDQRRPAAPTVPTAPVAAPTDVTVRDSTAVIPMAAGKVVANPKGAIATPVVAKTTTPATEPAEKAPPKLDSVVPQVVAKSAAADVPPAAPVAAPVTVDNTAQSADKAVAGYKDGTYRGWGTSRHGDIEAAVEIRDGRIAAAYITQCLTRYSCSWISHLPGQVVTRQSPEVDYVSGATQSTNAFYYAIVQALAKAK